MVVAFVARRDLAHTVAVRLASAVTNATGYVELIGALHGLPGVANTPDDPPTKSATDPRVRPYFVFFPGIGAPTDETDLGQSVIDLEWDFTITAAAADVDDLLALADRIDTALYRWSPGRVGTTDAPVLTGQVQHPIGYTPVLLPDRTVTPARVFTSLQYRLTAHT